MGAYSCGVSAWHYALDNNLTKSRDFIVVDFTIPSNKKRLFIYRNENLFYSTYCAHGSGSGEGSIAKKFSNTSNSHMSSIGVYLTGSTYTGKHGLSRKVKGLEYTNNLAEPRAIVIHSAKYVGPGKSGNSWGCFAVPIDEIEKILDLTAKGTIIVGYYPDKKWLATSKFLKEV
jgi:hypothetical protein